MDFIEFLTTAVLGSSKHGASSLLILPRLISLFTQDFERFHRKDMSHPMKKKILL